MKYSPIILFFLLFFSGLFSSGQVNDEKFYLLKSTQMSPEDKQLLDSLLPNYHKAAHDSDRLNTLGSIIELCTNDRIWPEYNKLMENIARSAAEREGSPAEKRFFISKLADAINNNGFQKINTGDVDGALKDFSESYDLQKKTGNKLGMAHSLSNLGYVFKNKGDIFKAIDAYHRSLKLSEECGDEKGVANLYNNIGLLYKNQGEIDRALENYKKSLALWTKLKNTAGMSAALNNLGFIYTIKGDPGKAFSCYEQSLKYDRENGDDFGIANSLNNIGVIFSKQGEKDKAYSYYKESYALFVKIGAKKGMSEVLTNLGKICFDKGDLSGSEKYTIESLRLARELGYPLLISDAASLLYDIYKEKKEWVKAIEMQELHSQMKDSILNNETQKAAMKHQLKYQFEKQEAEAKMERQKEIILAEEQNKRNRIITAATAGGLFLMIIFAGFIYNRYRVSIRQKKVIAEQKLKVDMAYDQLSEKNREIIDSIHYARRIQNALLKEEEHVSEHLPDHFILFKPKDIVSGDFYWSYERDGYWYVAAGDCTGHGVPGAFLTMLGTAFLNEIVSSGELYSPAEILNRLRTKVVKELSRSGNDTYDSSLLKDGMDMSLLKIHLASGEAEWSGANNGLLLYRRARTLTEQEKAVVMYLQPDKQPIGYYHHNKPFTDHKLTLTSGDTLYLFTDGYADQFGGPQGKKLKFKALQELLTALQHENMKSQKERLSAKFDQWKGNLEQVDDVTLIGVRI